MNLQKYDSSRDLYFLYATMSEECREHSLNSDVDFNDWLNRAFLTFYHIFYMLYENETPIGYICTYDYRMLDAHCKMKFYVKNELLDDFTPIIMEFINMIFREYPLNKVFYYISANESLQHSLLLKNGFKDEAILKHYIFTGYNYFDVAVMSRSRIKN